METLGALSGATLGYIVNNIPGAVTGGIIGRQFGRNYNSTMPPVTRSRSMAANRIQSAFRGWRRRGYPNGATESLLTSMGRRARRARFSSGRRNSVVTKQRDYGSQYRAKRMPGWKRRGWKRFVKKVTAIEIKNAALKTVLFNDKVSISTTGQNFVSFCLYGINGNGETSTTAGYQDMLKIFDNDPQIKQSAVGSPAVYYPSNGKLQFATAVLDYTIRNVSTDADAEVDVYIGYHKKDVPYFSTLQELAGSLRNEFTATNDDTIKSGNTTINLTDRGATVFECSRALSNSAFHVVKKMKFLIEPGKSVFMQHRDAKNYQLEQTDLARIGYAKKGLTYEVLVVTKPAVTVVGGGDVTSTIAVGVTRKYSYTVLAGNNQAQTALKPSFNPGP